MPNSYLCVCQFICKCECNILVKQKDVCWGNQCLAKKTALSKTENNKVPQKALMFSLTVCLTKTENYQLSNKFIFQFFIYMVICLLI